MSCWLPEYDKSCEVEPYIMNSGIRVLNLSSSPSFCDLRSLVLSRLTGVAKCIVGEMSDAQISELIPTELTDLRKDTELMLRVEGLLLMLLDEIGCRDHGALQFPANIRTIGSGELARRAPNNRGYATDLIHCDAWSGAPSDSWNHLLYLLYVPDAPYLEIFETLPPNNPLRNYLGNYASVQLDPAELRRVSATPERGVMVVWPTYSPHRTVVPTDSVGLAWRVSIDFRTRLGSPYDDDRNFSGTSFSGSQMNSDGLYWSFPNLGGDMETKILFEMQEAARHGADALSKRIEYIQRYYPRLLKG